MDFRRMDSRRMDEGHPSMIEVVSATRMSETEFWQKAALGLSLKRLAGKGRRLAPQVAFENRIGLSEVFNRRIHADSGDDILVFMHDDVWIDDYFFADRIIDGLERYDVIGVAGATRLLPGQTGFVLPGGQAAPEILANLSGRLAHGQFPFAPVHALGPVPAACEFLDGVFLAARRSTLRSHKVFFDARFDFHFYDVDFCRTARAQGLRLGTWPICLTHQGTDTYGAPAWQHMLDVYQEKWGA
jgi:GT2 family glycosyltransferase